MTLSFLLGKHDQVSSTTQSQESKTPWYTHMIHIEGQCRRKLTRKRQKSGSQKCKKFIITQQNKVIDVKDEAKRYYIYIAIVKADKKSEIIFRTLRK